MPAASPPQDGPPRLTASPQEHSPPAVATRGSTTILVGYRPAVYPARAPELDDLAAVPGSNRVWGVGSQPRLHGSLLKNFGLVAVNR